MIGVGDERTSSIRPLRRFSNSPFTPAPACSSARSSVRSVTSRSTGGTSPCAMRCASPSTTAVLPTPASPTRIGLFCRRRVRMSTAWRISKSRPSTLSSAPERARSVRLMVNWSRLGVLPPAARERSPPPGASGAALGVSSIDCSTMVLKSLRRLSTLILPSSRLMSWARRRKSSSFTSASRVCPVRMVPAPKSTEPMSHPPESILVSDGLSAGVRALPALSLSRLRARSADNRERLISKCLRMYAPLASAWSSSFMRKCSISTS